MGNYADPDCVDSDFALTACKIVQKVNLFRNRVNVLRIKHNLFSMTSPLELGRLARPRTIPTQSLHNAVTQLRSYAVA